MAFPALTLSATRYKFDFLAAAALVIPRVQRAGRCGHLTAGASRVPVLLKTR